MRTQISVTTTLCLKIGRWRRGTSESVGLRVDLLVGLNEEATLQSHKELVTIAYGCQTELVVDIYVEPASRTRVRTGTGPPLRLLSSWLCWLVSVS